MARSGSTRWETKRCCLALPAHPLFTLTAPCVLAQATVVQLQPANMGQKADYEPYPRIGQNIAWLSERHIGEVARVDKFRMYIREGDELWSGYELSRILYAQPHHLQVLDGGALRVGAEVRLLAGHEEARITNNSHGTGPDIAGTWTNSAPSQSRLEVTAICSTCRCVEIRHSFGYWHVNFGPIDLPARDLGCPLNHEHKCSHMGHAGACKYACNVCDGFWDDVQLQCGCGFDRSSDAGRLCEICPESQGQNVSSGEWLGAVRAATAAAAALTATAIISAATATAYDSAS